MERVNTLINKLQEQVINNASTKQILDIAQLLVSELSGIEQPEEIGKVSVWMPSVYFSGTTVSEPIVAKEEVVEIPMISVVAGQAKEMIEVAPIKVVEAEKPISVPDQPVEIAARKAAMIAVKPREIYNFNVLVEEEEHLPTLVMHNNKETFELNDLFVDKKQSFNDVLKKEEPLPALIIDKTKETSELNDLFVDKTQNFNDVLKEEQPLSTLVVDNTKETFELNDVFIDENVVLEEEELLPTLIMHNSKETFELNDLVVNEKQGFNDLLKVEKKEVVSKLVDIPVKDLRKAIGINDKYLYINELFQGDENMYERSVKTINNFSVFPEAEHWIKRELHTKLCWVESNQTVKQFDDLVRRRFA